MRTPRQALHGLVQARWYQESSYPVSRGVVQVGCLDNRCGAARCGMRAFRAKPARQNSLVWARWVRPQSCVAPVLPADSLTSPTRLVLRAEPSRVAPESGRAEVAWAHGWQLLFRLQWCGINCLLSPYRAFAAHVRAYAEGWTNGTVLTEAGNWSSSDQDQKCSIPPFTFHLPPSALSGAREKNGNNDLLVDHRKKAKKQSSSLA